MRGLLTATEAAAACDWRYDPPYNLYDADESPGYLLDPANRYAAIVTEVEDFAGYVCVGVEARVPGGDYAPGEPEVLDLGIGNRPELAGRGLGRAFLGAAIDFAVARYEPAVVRVTVAGFNARSRQLHKRLGFVEAGTFTSAAGLEFVVATLSVDARTGERGTSFDASRARTDAEAHEQAGR